MSWATDSHASMALATHLASAGHGTLAETIWVDYYPETPDVLTALSQYSAPVMQHLVMAPQASSVARVQLHARGGPNDPDTARARLWGAYESLCRLGEATVAITGGTVRIISIEPDSDPELLEYDDRQRPVFVANIDVTYALGD